MSGYHIATGDCQTELKRIPDNAVDSVVTDPPAGISFMGKEWDEDKGGRDHWIAWLASVMQECLRVLKPGGHALVWALPRTSHWTATAIEDAGFEIRDVVTHHFGTGFPKSMDVSKAIDKSAGAEREIVGSRPIAYADSPSGYSSVSANSSARHGGIWNPVTGQTEGGRPISAPATEAAKKWAGWGTALKPASEHWILARKPLIGTVAENVLEHGTGGINVDACRIETSEKMNGGLDGRRGADVYGKFPGEVFKQHAAGRFPANLILSHADACAPGVCDGSCPIEELDGQRGVLHTHAGKGARKGMGYHGSESTATQIDIKASSGGASRFFYVAKPAASEKGAAGEKNPHPTVKPVALMDYLIRLVTPPGGIVLDPFCGSGTTGVAAVRGGWRFFGIERDAGYAAFAEKRIEAALAVAA